MYLSYIKTVPGSLEQHSKLQYTWRKEWIHQYESPWGIIEKFRFANVLNENDIFELFLEVNKRKTKLITKNQRNLIKLEELSSESMEQILGIDLRQDNQKNKDRILGVLPVIDHGKMIRKELNYCPRCLETGYHSILHQVKLFDKCAFHQIPLQQKCPQCSRTIPYEISYQWSKDAFQCKCGHKFIVQDLKYNFMNIWSNKKQLNVKLPPAKKWLNLTPREKIILKNTFILPDVLEQFTGYVLDHLLILLNVKEISDISNSRYKSNYSCFTNTTLDFLKDFHHYNIFSENNSKISEICKPLFKSVARNIRHKNIPSYKKNIYLMVSDRFPKILNTARAYVFWRTGVENISHYWKVDNSSYIPKAHIGNLIDKTYQILILFLNQFVDVYRGNASKETIYWLALKIYSKILLNYYEICFDRSVNYANEHIYNGWISYGEAAKPKFLIVMQKTTGSEVVLNWIDIKPNDLNCNFKIT